MLRTKIHILYFPITFLLFFLLNFIHVVIQFYPLILSLREYNNFY